MAENIKIEFKADAQLALSADNYLEWLQADQQTAWAVQEHLTSDPNGAPWKIDRERAAAIITSYAAHVPQSDTHQGSPTDLRYLHISFPSATPTSLQDMVGLLGEDLAQKYSAGASMPSVSERVEKDRFDLTINGITRPVSLFTYSILFALYCNEKGGKRYTHVANLSTFLTETLRLPLDASKTRSNLYQFTRPNAPRNMGLQDSSLVQKVSRGFYALRDGIPIEFPEADRPREIAAYIARSGMQIL